MSTLYEKFNEVKKASNNEHYSTISVRTPIEIASMVETVSTVTEEAVMNMFTTDISLNLANYLLEDSKNMELIKQVLHEEFEKHGAELEDMVKGSCLEVLEQNDFLKIGNYINFNLDSCMKLFEEYKAKSPEEGDKPDLDT
ncbi:hypothetical protein [Psychrobacter sp. ENNN9_III]|uniref:hypothetical protein n=1 Tax=Psychrobacter sp. ENNN9_III TaxID=1254334 RepID=UPI00071E89D5|nr:hypothetical protein [Psychrobacter sp. ENNN9_III]